MTWEKFLLRYILNSAGVVGDCSPSEAVQVLKNKRVREFGEFRTRRLVLAAWDDLAN